MIDPGDLGHERRPPDGLTFVIVHGDDRCPVENGDREYRQGDEWCTGDGQREGHGDRSAPESCPTPVEPIDGGLSASRQQDGKHARQVVGLPAGCHEDHRQQQVGPPDRPAPPKRRLAEEPDHPDDPDRSEVRADQHQLFREEQGPRRRGSGIARGDRPAHRQLGPAVTRLPDQVGRPDEEGRDSSAPQPRRSEEATRSDQGHADHQRCHQKGDQVAVEESDSGDDADEEPPPLVPGSECPQDEPDQQGPDEQVEDCRVEIVTGAQQEP